MTYYSHVISIFPMWVFSWCACFRPQTCINSMGMDVGVYLRVLALMDSMGSITEIHPCAEQALPHILCHGICQH